MKTIYAALLISAAGCTSDTSDTGAGVETSAGPSCEDSATVIALDELTDLGVSGQTLLDQAGALTETELYWVDGGGTTALSLAVAHTDGQVRWVRSEVVPCTGDGDCPALEPVCDDRLEVDVSVTFQTEDGAFDEAWATTLISIDGQAANFKATLDPDALGGTWTPAALNPDQYDSFSMWTSGRFDVSGASGSISAQGSGTDGDVSWAENLEIARWPAAAEY